MELIMCFSSAYLLLLARNTKMFFHLCAIQNNKKKIEKMVFTYFLQPKCAVPGKRGLCIPSLKSILDYNYVLNITIFNKNKY